VHVRFVTRRYWPAVGGVERVAMDLGAALIEEGHEVSVVAQRIDEGPHARMTHVIREAPVFSCFRHGSVSVRQLRLSRRRRALLLPFAGEHIPLMGRFSERWLRRHTSRWFGAVARPAIAPLLAGADVVHVLGGDLLAAATVDAARAVGHPVVVSPFAHPGAWGLDAGSLRAYREADAVLATIEADAAVYRAAGVPAEQVRVVGLPVPPLTTRAEPGADDAPLVLFLGARRETKGIDLLLAAAERLWRTDSSVRFAFVGPGPPLPITDERLLDVGEVTDAERADWLARSTLLCLPSESESFGLVVAEAWAARKPVVVSDIPVLRELVTQGEGGLAAPRQPDAMAGAIRRLVHDEALARRMAESGWRLWDREYRPESVARRHLEVYAESMAGGSRPSTSSSRRGPRLRRSWSSL
jgi:glycosyltransferase involved in cell wall biosynthesis